MAAATDFLASAGGLTLGYIILAGIGPRLRSFGAYTPGDFVAARFGGGLPRIVSGLISFSVSMLVLVAHLKIAGPLIATLLRITPEHALYAATVLTAITTLPGGMRSFTWTQAIQYFVIALACIVPAAFLVLDSSGADTAACAELRCALHRPFAAVAKPCDASIPRPMLLRGDRRRLATPHADANADGAIERARPALR